MKFGMQMNRKRDLKKKEKKRMNEEAKRKEKDIFIMNK